MKHFKDTKMKKFLIALNIVIWSIVAVEVAYSAETKQICRDKVVKGKTVNQCKTIRVHKMYEGTKVPTPAPVAKKPVAKQPAKKK